MILIICNTKQKPFFKKLFSHFESEKYDEYTFICDKDEYHSKLPFSASKADQIIIEISLGWGGKNLQDFYGFELAKSLRRDYFVAEPIVFSSSLRKTYFDKFDLLKVKGSGFLSFPFAIETLRKELTETLRLNESELNEIVISYCGLQKEWRSISHNLGAYIQNYQQKQLEITNLVGRWIKTITRFAPEQKANLDKFQHLLKSSSESVNKNELKLVLQNLDEGLMNRKESNASQETLEDNLEIFPNYPPKGFSKILVADDEPLDSLINGLQNEYRYEIVGQAKGSNEAERLLNEKKPDVVLSDFYFKKYTHDATTNKKYGESFMRLAKQKEIGSEKSSKNPIVAVISKTTLDPFEIPSGVLNCSGAFNATNPEFIHKAIWAEAKRRGVFEPAMIAGREWRPEYRCRQRLEPYQSDLPKLTRQWMAIKETVRDTLALIQSVPASKTPNESQIIGCVINTLKSYEKAEDFSFKEVVDIFTEIEKAHKKAKEQPLSEAKLTIRNILHGKIKQFSCAANDVKFARKVLSKAAWELISLPEFNQFGNTIGIILNNFNEEEKLLPFLKKLEGSVNSVLKELPAIPQIERPFKLKDSDIKRIKIIVVEDNKFWSETVISAIEKVKLRLAKNFEISYQYFDNTTDALKAVPKVSNTPNSHRERDDAKTIAIVDICLPKSNEQIPDSKHGIELIQNLSGYTINIPLIVFSTKSSLEDIKAIGKSGIPDGNFTAKDFDAEPALVQSLLSIIEKKDKFTVRSSHQEINGKDYYTFFINNLEIPFRPQLNATFRALYELAEEGGNKNKLQFTAEHIYLRMSQNNEEEDFGFSEKEKHKIHSDINGIRRFIHATFRKNNLYINVREIIKTVTDKETEESFYELNAELPSFEDEENRQEDDEEFQNRKYNILIFGKNSEYQNQIVGALKKLSDSGQIKIAGEDLVQTAIKFRPDIICLDLEQIDCLAAIKNSLPNERLGVIVTTTNEEKNKKRLLVTAIKSGVPNSSVVTPEEKNWINVFLTKLDNEKRRVFLSKIADSSREIGEPVVEIRNGSNLESGILNLNVNGESVKMKKGENNNIARIIGFLLLNPKTLISLEIIKTKAIKNFEPVTDDEQKGWTRKIRNKIQTAWIKSEDRELVKKVLESSSKGMKLNVQVIDSQTKNDL